VKKVGKSKVAAKNGYLLALTSLQPFLAATFDFPSPRLFKAVPLFHSLAVFE